MTASKTPANQAAPAEETTTVELTGVLRIDPAPGEKKFQGVFVEVPGRDSFLVAYRPNSLWRQFENVEVVVTGGCYEPFGQAIINRTHLRIDTLRPTKDEHGRRPYLSIGPEQWLTGELRSESGSPGTKLEGSSWVVFAADGGTTYRAVGDDLSQVGRRAKVRGRVLEPDMSYAARTAGPDLWIARVVDVDHVDDPAEAPRPLPCP